MEDLSTNSATTAVMATACLLSLIAGFSLFQRHIGGQPLLAYEPRRRVPWGSAVLLIPLFFLVSKISEVIWGASQEEKVLEPDDFIFNSWIFSLLLLSMVTVVVAWLIRVRSADASDLGLPANSKQLGRDVWIGIVACVAVLLPIYLIQFSLIITFQPEQTHPLVEQLLEHRAPGMMWVGFFSAVIAAPVFEEFTFRVLLQGWLERYEDEQIQSRDALSEMLSTEETEADEEADSLPTPGLLGLLPRGWMPIIISGVLFGLAHWGHGVAPVPLALFGIVLGYIYQRTHRIVPGLVAHALFNGYSIALLWLTIDTP